MGAMRRGTILFAAVATLVLAVLLLDQSDGGAPMESGKAELNACDLQPALNGTVHLRERIWSVLKTVDIFDGEGTLLGYVYTSSFALDGRTKWVRARDGKMLAMSVTDFQAAPTMLILPQLEPSLGIEDCRGKQLAKVAYGDPDPTLLTITTPGGTRVGSSKAGGRGGLLITVRDQHGGVAARIQKLAGRWTDNWDLTLVGEGGGGARDPRVLVLAVAAESPALNIGRGIQVGKAPVAVMGGLLLMGSSLCLIYMLRNAGSVYRELI